MGAPAVRRARMLMTLAYAAEMAVGQSRDFALRSCVLAMRLAAALGLNELQKRNVYHQALLRYIGCNADTHLLTAEFGDEIALRQDLARADLGSREDVGAVFVRALTRRHADAAPDELAGAIERGLAQVMEVSVPIIAGHCEIARKLGMRMGLAPEICDNLGQLYERWDGHGLPNGLRGDAVSIAVRLVTLAQDAIVLADVNGFEAMTAMVAARKDGAYEAALVDVFLAGAKRYMEDIGGGVDRETVLALEPEPHAVLDEQACEEAYVAIADMIDMRMPHTYGHSRAVAALAAAAAKQSKLPAADICVVRWAAYAHDIGELAIPVAVWMKAKPLTVREMDTIRLHPYHGERALAALGDDGKMIAGLVSRHHERLDGSGYHRAVRGNDLSPAARILAAAEAFQTAREARPYRDALGDVQAASRLRGLVREGRLCPEAVEAVLSCAGQPTRRAPADRLAGLTPREIEVLRLIAAGHTAKEVARALAIAPKTADNHIQSLYAKIGVATRAGAALYAVEHGLLPGGSSSAA